MEVYDGMFFHKGQPWNQGNIYDFDEEDFLNRCEESIAKFNDQRENKAGLKLQEEFTYEKTTDLILKELEKL